MFSSEIYTNYSMKRTLFFFMFSTPGLQWATTFILHVCCAIAVVWEVSEEQIEICKSKSVPSFVRKKFKQYMVL
jgi:hypothetical protein